VPCQSFYPWGKRTEYQGILEHGNAIHEDLLCAIKMDMSLYMYRSCNR
jgi:hypothetical protein